MNQCFFDKDYSILIYIKGKNYRGIRLFKSRSKDEEDYKTYFNQKQ